MRRLAVTIALVFELSGYGCTSTVQSNVAAPIVSEGERSAAMSQLLDCQLAAARQFDDGKSDAATIGRAVTTLCTRQSEGVFETLTRGQPEVRVRALRERWPQSVNDWSTTAVLHVRSSTKSSQP